MSASNSAKKTPAYVQFCTALRLRFAAAGVPLVETQGTMLEDLPGPSNYVLFQDTRTQAKLYVPRFVDAPRGPSETTLTVHPSSPAFVKDMAGKNGKIEARVATDLELLASEVIPLFVRAAASGERLRDARTPARRTVIDVPVRSEAGDAEVASWTPAPGDLEAASWK